VPFAAVGAPPLEVRLVKRRERTLDKSQTIEYKIELFSVDMRLIRAKKQRRGEMKLSKRRPMGRHVVKMHTGMNPDFFKGTVVEETVVLPVRWLPDSRARRFYHVRRHHP
jgi:hypothetical protein